MRYLSPTVAGTLAFTDLFQVHLLLAIYLGIKLARRWQTVWPAVAVASSAYAAVACSIAFVGYTPSGYLVLILGMLADLPFEAVLGRASSTRLWTLGVCVTFVVLAGAPTGIAWLLRRHVSPPAPAVRELSWRLPLALGMALLVIQQVLVAAARRTDATMAMKVAGGLGLAMSLPIVVAAGVGAYRLLRQRGARSA